MAYSAQQAISSQVEALNNDIQVIDGQVQRLCAEWHALRSRQDQAIIDWRTCAAYPGDAHTLLAYPIIHEPNQYHLILVDQSLAQYPDHPLYRLTEYALHLISQIEQLVAQRKELMSGVYALLQESQRWGSGGSGSEHEGRGNLSMTESEDMGSGRRWWIQSDPSGDTWF